MINKKRHFDITVSPNPMTISDQIKFYVDNGFSFMLHGPSGIGKSRRIEEIDPEFVSIILRNGMLPEEVVGKTIYLNNDKKLGGTWAPPAWYVNLCQKCASEPHKNHVLFLDEITNVRPTEQSLIFHIVLNRSIGPNVGPLPKNVVIVGAGNNKEQSEAAYNMPEPLFRRFVGHIDLEPDIQSWIEWGSQPKNLDTNQQKIHPLVLNFVGTYGYQVFYTPYNSEEPPKYAVDPRAWEQISNIIYSSHGVLNQNLLANKIGNQLTATFLDFAKNPPLEAEDIIIGNYNPNKIPTNTNAQFALIATLRNTKIEDLSTIRSFIEDHLAAEMLPVFDALWIGQDDERAIALQQDKSQKSQSPKPKTTLPKRKLNLGTFFANNQETLYITCTNDLQIKMFCKECEQFGKKLINDEPYTKKSNMEEFLSALNNSENNTIYFSNDGMFNYFPKDNPNNNSPNHELKIAKEDGRIFNFTELTLRSHNHTQPCAEK